MTKTEEFIRKARLKLSSKLYRFLGLCLYPIRVIPIECDPDLEGFVNYETNSNRFENQIHINSVIIDNHPKYKTKNMIDILMHELFHILKRHDSRCGNRDKDIWNVACDHINDMSLKKMNLSEPIIGYNIIQAIEHNDSLQSEEEVYKWLIKNKNRVEIGKDSSDNNSNSSGDDSNNNNSNSNSKSKIKVKDTYNGQEFSFVPDLSQTNIRPEQKQVVEDYVSQIRAIYNIEKEKGTITADLKNMFDELLKIEIPWETLLEKAIKANAVEKSNRRSWRRLNKHYINLGIHLPGNVSSRDQDAVNTLIIHIDSSGSIDNENLRKAGYVIVKSAQYFEKIILLIADVKIKQEVIFNKREFKNIEDYFKDAGITGRGGTSHRFIFEYVDKYYELNPDNLSMVISITDMYSDIEGTINKAEFVKVVPLILINTSNKRQIKHNNITNITCV